MTIDNEQELAQRAQVVDARGREKYGNEVWPELVASLSRAGITGQPVAQALVQPDAVDRFARTARECLLNEMSNTADTSVSRNAEATYNDIREKERERFRKLKGRR